MPDEWIRQWGDPALRESASDVESVDDILRAQVRRMQRLLEAVNGAGLAGPQVGWMRRVFVFRPDTDSPADALINPRVVDTSSESATFIEGCLSFNTVVVEIVRPFAVRVEGQALDGSRRVLEAEGFAASLLQHEIDHLDGILTLDRATPVERSRVVSELLAQQHRAA